MKQLKLEEEAREFFLKACRQVPVLWAAWYELAKTCTDRDMVSILVLWLFQHIAFCIQPLHKGRLHQPWTPTKGRVPPFN